MVLDVRVGESTLSLIKLTKKRTSESSANAPNAVNWVYNNCVRVCIRKEIDTIHECMKNE